MSETTPRRVASIEELKNLVGVTLGPTRWHQVTQDDINAFADITQDHQWIHIDTERAAESPFGGTIAHGLYGLSRTPALMAELLQAEGFRHVLNYGYDKVRFTSPVPVGSRIRMSAEVIRAEERSPGELDVVTRLTLETEESDKPSLVAESIGRFVS